MNPVSSQVEQHQRPQDHPGCTHLAAVEPFPEKEKAGQADDQDHPYTVRGVDQEGGKLPQGRQQQSGG